MPQAAGVLPKPDPRDARSSMQDQQIHVQKESSGGHRGAADVDEIVAVLRDIVRDMVAEGVGNLQRTILQTERNLSLRLCAVEDLIAKDLAIHQPRQKSTHQQQGVEEADTSRLQSPSPVPAQTASTPPLPVHPAPVQAASPALAPARQAPPAAPRAQSTSVAPTTQGATPSAAAQVAMAAKILQQALPPTVPVARHSAPPDRRMAVVAPASAKQALAATKQDSLPPNSFAGGAAASSTGLSTTGTGHGTGSGAIRSWPASRPSFWSFGGSSKQEGPKTLDAILAELDDQILEKADCQDPRSSGPSLVSTQKPSSRTRGGAVPTPAVAQNLPGVASTQDIAYSSEPLPMTILPSMVRAQTPDGFTYFTPPQSEDRRTSPSDRHEAVATEEADSGPPQRRTGLDLSRLLGFQLPRRTQLRSMAI